MTAVDPDADRRDVGTVRLPVAVDATPPPTETPQSVADTARAGHDFPKPGETFLGFRLEEELGRGAFGRVFLARQGDLAGRPVALKVAYDLGFESRTLAQLQHTNIVPVHSVHRAGRLQAVCMPYFGRATLARVVEKTHRGLPSSAREMVSTIVVRAEGTVRVNPDAGRPLPPATDAPPVGWAKLDGLSYVEAVLWVGAELADGLAHAHDRGILHRDLKPANVLLTDDGRPMLLDFNLAEDTKLRGTADGAGVGGTLPYMAPEQLRGFRHDPPPPLDGRADVYALGVLLFELLAGKHPFPHRPGPGRAVLRDMLADREAGAPPLRVHNPAVSPAAEAVVRTCLAPRPADRYPSMAALRDDLRRHLDHKPLLHAPNPSARERVRKWARRNPKLTSAAAVGTATGLLVALAAGGAAIAYDRQQAAHCRAALLDHREAVQDARLAAVRGERGRPDVEAQLAALVAVPARYAAAPQSDDWLSSPAVRRLSEADRATVRREVGEAFLLQAAANARLARGADRDRHLTDADVQLAAAGRHADHLPWAVAQQAADLAAVRGSPDAPALQSRADAVPPATPRDLVMKASRLVGRGQARDALPLLLTATQQEPQDVAAWFLRAAAHADLGQADLAAAGFGTCLALKPGLVAAWVNRGVQYARGRHHHLARADFDTALTLNPDEPRAYLERGLARDQAGDTPGAVADLGRAADYPEAGPLAVFRRADVRRKAGDAAGAAADAAEGFRRPPRLPIDWVARAEMRLKFPDPARTDRQRAEDALADVQGAFALDPDFPPARQMAAHLLSEKLGRPAEAVAMLDALVSARPLWAPALAGRAVLHARLGDRDRAVADARAALRADASAATRYQAAGAFARFHHNPDDKREALALLNSALRTGYGLDKLAADPELDGLRADPEFRQVVAQAKAAARR
jgi:serine/threonine protein kinase/Tfp pilus assembly protein PilF